MILCFALLQAYMGGHAGDSSHLALPGTFNPGELFWCTVFFVVLVVYMLLLVENIVNFSMLRLVADIFGKCIAKYEKI